MDEQADMRSFRERQRVTMMSLCRWTPMQQPYWKFKVVIQKALELLIHTPPLPKREAGGGKWACDPQGLIETFIDL